MIRVSDYIVTFLLEQGVRDIFTASGGGVIFLDDAIALNKKMKYYCVITNRPWPAAEAYTRVNGKIGVSVVTKGPGSTNTLTGVAGSWMDSVPSLFFSDRRLYSTPSARPACVSWVFRKSISSILSGQSRNLP